jgi:hypothetical protein
MEKEYTSSDSSSSSKQVISRHMTQSKDEVPGEKERMKFGIDKSKDVVTEFREFVRNRLSTHFINKLMISCKVNSTRC